MATLSNEIEALNTWVREVYKTFLKFTKTIRFKLAFFYSGILFLFTSGIVLTFNLYLSKNLQEDPSPQIIQFVPNTKTQIFFKGFEVLSEEERARIREIRLNDLRKIQRSSIIAMIPLALLSFGAGYYISGQYLDPLGRLKRDIEKLDTKNLGSTFETEIPDDEVGELVKSFNDLSVRLNTAFHAQEQFVQNASHELRTPLTIIQTNLDTVLDNPNATKDEIKVGVQQALGGVRQLKKLVNYLLELTNVSPSKFVKISVWKVMETQVDALTLRARENNLSFDLRKVGKSSTIIMSDEILLGRVFMNVLENAIKYTSITDESSKWIRVNVTGQKDRVVVSVSNASTPMTKDNTKKVFDRFYQVDPSRNKKLGGYGLGLAIAKKIIEEHEGTIHMEHENGLTTVLIALKKTK